MTISGQMDIGADDQATVIIKKSLKHDSSVIADYAGIST